jgi:hypothetical protein
MICLNIILAFVVIAYFAIAFRDKTKTTVPVFDPRTKTWRRDLTAHEVKLYNEMRRHWSKQAKATYKKINEYDKRKSST